MELKKGSRRGCIRFFPRRIGKTHSKCISFAEVLSTYARRSESPGWSRGRRGEARKRFGCEHPVLAVVEPTSHVTFSEDLETK